MADAIATLSAHVDGYKCSEDAVRAIKAPEATATWNPISHGTLIDLVAQELDKRDMRIESKDFAMVGKGGEQMFSAFTLRSDRNKDFTLALGLRNSINKTLPAGLCAGSRVFVCDNLAFSSLIVLGRKHTTNIERDLPMLISSALDKFNTGFADQEAQFNKWKSIQVSDEAASRIILNMAEKGLVPTPRVITVRNEFRKPRFKEFDGQTAWGLYNAATTVLRWDRKEINPIRHSDDLLGIHEMMATEFAERN
jgi:hypothetical protein